MFWTFMVVLVAVIAVTQVAISEETSTRYQTLPGSTTRDYGAPSYVTMLDSGKAKRRGPCRAFL